MIDNKRFANKLVTYGKILSKDVFHQEIVFKQVYLLSKDDFLRAGKSADVAMSVNAHQRILYFRYELVDMISYLDMLSCLAHELTHVYCYTNGMGYHDTDRDFVETCLSLELNLNCVYLNDYVRYRDTKHTSDKFLKTYCPGLYMKFWYSSNITTRGVWYKRELELTD